MANSLSAIAPTVYLAADMVAREQAGFIRGCFVNSEAERISLNQTVTYPIVPTMTTANITPSNVLPTGTDQTLGAGSMSISKSKSVSWPSTGEEQKLLRTGDRPQGASVLQLQFEEAMRQIVNEIEADIWAEAYKNASRAHGTAGTTPFGTAADFSDFAQTSKILTDNGCPLSDRHLVLGSAAVANLQGKQSSLFKANEAGSDEMLRTGRLGEVLGFNIHQSYPITTHTKGTGASYQLSAAGAVNDTSIAVDTGSGTILAGDIVTFAGTSDKYVVNTALSGGTFAIGKPGLRTAEADNDAVTVGNNYTPNVAFHRNALHLLLRAPAMPEGGDAADDVMDIVDQVTGLVFQIAIYKERRQVVYEIGAAWGVKAVKSNFIATLIG